MSFNLDSYLLLVPIFIAVAIGWLLGRRDARKKHREPSSLNYEYFTGLDYLLSEKVDEAIESFIRALEINSDTIPAHLALAKLFRRKGDVERAIQIHQSLLARPDLGRENFMRIQMALARDYYAVGLLDRAENLLEEICKVRYPKETQLNALMLLIKLYETEGEWEQALAVAETLSINDRKKLAKELAHYCCELAERATKNKQLKQTKEYLKKAESFDKDNVRSSLLYAQVAMAEHQWKLAIKYLKIIFKQDPLFISEVIPLLHQCYQQVDNKREYLNSLREGMAQATSATTLIALTKQMEISDSGEAATNFLAKELTRRPSVKGFNYLINLYIKYGAEETETSLYVLKNLTDQLEQSKPVYRCNNCGFSSRALSWHCPSCKNWGTTKPIQGLEGE